MTIPTTIRRRICFAGLQLCLAPFAQSQTAQIIDTAPLVVEDVSCAGNEHTACAFIRDHLYLKSGQLLDEEEIRNAELRLSSLRNFESVKIRLEKGAERGAVIVVIEVKEASQIAMEWLLGVSSRSESQRVVLAGRIGHQNLFGKGKIADLSVVGLVPFAGDARNEVYDITLRYADPQLFDSSRYFAVASASWLKGNYRDIHGNFAKLDAGQFELTVGRRIADFSYFSAAMFFRPDDNWVAGYYTSDGSFVFTRAAVDSYRALRLAYGWSTEDDLHFPTQGSSLQIATGGIYKESLPTRYSDFQFRKTWQGAGGYWTFKVGGDPSPEYRSLLGEDESTSMSYARPLKAGGEIQRGRWYIEPGFAFTGYGSSGLYLFDYGLKVGFRADTRTFGLVDLYLLGTKATVR